MQTLILEITHADALKALHALEEKQFIKIIDEKSLNTPSLSGKILDVEAFKNWIAKAEVADTVSLNTAKSSWINKRKQLQKIAK